MTKCVGPSETEIYSKNSFVLLFLIKQTPIHDLNRFKPYAVRYDWLGFPWIDNWMQYDKNVDKTVLGLLENHMFTLSQDNDDDKAKHVL